MSDLIRALKDVSDNDGTMWRVRSSYEAETLWRQLKANGLVELNPWSSRYQPSDSGRAALAKSRETK